MGAKTGIEWTDATWNPILGCSRVSEGCRNCYAEGVAARFERRKDGEPTVYSGLTQIVNGHPQWTGKIVETRQLLRPLGWRKPKRVFVNSMSDLFHENVTDEQRDRIFAVMALCPQHTFQVLTKRASAMRAYLSDEDLGERLSAASGDMLDGEWIWKDGKRFRKAIEHNVSRFLGLTEEGDIDYESPEMLPLPNVWLGVSVENQATADERIPLLLQTPAAVRFISAEPLLGPVMLPRRVDVIHGVRGDYPIGHRLYAVPGEQIAYSNPHGALAVHTPEGELLGIKPGEFDDLGIDLDWVICGGESGPHARPMHPEWARSLRDQCQAAGVPFFFKQWGEWGPKPRREDLPGKPTMYCGGDVLLTTAGEIESYESCGGIGEHAVMARVGKKAAGALLDGVEHKASPEARA